MPAGEAMRQRGFTYLILLFIVAIMGVMLAASATVWHTLAQRDKEHELLYAGHAFRRAIGLYYERTPAGSIKQYPKQLSDLLADKRQLVLARYLRKIYIDPLTASKQWGVVPGPDGTIMGVYSRSEATPIKTGNFEEADTSFAGKIRYQDWQFIYLPTAPTSAPVAPLPPPGAPSPVSGAPNKLPGTSK
ncbi:MAG TPA: type II secretion system pseudopilin PulG [Betaproteobacteria bacterium]|nr:type II secretion system pseudopilin PulG [Betaproteobacteria bacterium]